MVQPQSKDFMLDSFKNHSENKVLTSAENFLRTLLSAMNVSSAFKTENLSLEGRQVHISKLLTSANVSIHNLRKNAKGNT